jgi:FkbM family methyltransferase
MGLAIVEEWNRLISENVNSSMLGLMPSMRREQLRQLALIAGRRLSRVRLRGIPHLMYWSRRMIMDPGTHVVSSVSGRRLAIDASDYRSCMMFYGRFSPELITLINSIVQPGDSVVDVGAQLGYVTAHLAERVGSNGSVHSFEPDPNAIVLLRSTVGANNYSWVKIFPIALSDLEGEIDFNVSPTLGWSTAVNGSHLQGLSQIRVRAASFDKLAENGEIRRPVKFVKIDVEGWECAVLDGMQKTISRDRPLILAEVNPLMLKPNGLDTVDLLSRLARFQYRLLRVDEPPGLLNGGRVSLSPVAAAEHLAFCDVLAVPEERELPLSFLPN